MVIIIEKQGVYFRFQNEWLYIPSTSIDTAIKASSWTPPDLQLLELNICSKACIIASDILGASSGVIFLRTL